MKKNILLIFAAAALLCTGCSLDEYPLNGPSTGSFPSTGEEARAGVLGAYKNLANNLQQAIKVRGITLFANATNLLTLTNYYQGYDPENTFTTSGDGVTTGSVANNYPLVKTYTFGVDIKF